MHNRKGVRIMVWTTVDFDGITTALTDAAGAALVPAIVLFGTFLAIYAVPKIIRRYAK